MPRRMVDFTGRAAAWVCGLSLLFILGTMVVWLTVRGASQLSWGFLTKSPAPGSVAGLAGGIADPIVGTILLALLGTAIALPLGLIVPVFLSEYRRPAALARATELGVEAIFGVPSIVFAIFGV